MNPDAPGHDLGPAVAFYEGLLDKSADERRAVGWQTSFAQDVAFLSLARVEGLRDGSRILDVGCGLGALKTFFDRTGVRVDYTGIDISQRMIDGARNRHPASRFELRNILREPMHETFDFVFCSGALSFRVADQPGYMKDMVVAMYAMADVALAFNMLSAWGLMRSPTLQRDAIEGDYAWPEHILRACKRMAPYVTVAHDMVRQRFDVFMYKKHRGALARYLEHVKPGKRFDAAARAVVDYHLELGLFDELRAFLATLDPSAAVCLELGRVALLEGKAAEATTAFLEAAALAPRSAEPQLYLARAAQLRNASSEAIQYLRDALELEPAHTEAREALVRILVAQHRRAEARAALAGFPASSLAHYLAALVADDAATERAELERALALSPRYLEALVRFARLTARANDVSAARDAYARALELAPFDRSLSDELAALR